MKHAKLVELNTEIQKLVFGRDVILVNYSSQFDVPFLKAANIDLNPLYVLDTQKAAQHPLDLDYRPSLKQLLRLLGCPCGTQRGTLHVSGNDATFALCAMLCLASVDS